MAGWLRDLILDHEDFLLVEAGFGPKSAALRRIAARLGVGLDAVALLDDSPIERAEVQANAPEVRVIDAPVDAFRELLLSGEGFVPWDGAAAGLRAASTAARLQVEAVAAAGEAGLLRFLEGLEIELQLRRAADPDRPRIDELLRRSHQLRLSGRADLPRSLADVWVWQVRDRLAEHGLVGVAWFANEGEGLRLVELAMSCRVLPLRVAGSALAALLAQRPGASVERVDTGRNGASVGLIAEAEAGVAPHVRLLVSPEEGP